MKSRRPLLLLVGGLLIIWTAQILNHFQVQASTEKAITQAYVSQNLLPARDLKLAFERGMGFGKPLSLFSGTDKLFAGLQNRYEGIEYMALTSTDLQVYAESKSGSNLLSSILAEEHPLFAEIATPANLMDYRTIVKKGMVLIATPLYFNDTQLKGIAWLGFSRGKIESQMAVESSTSLLFLGIFLLGATFLFALAYRFAAVEGDDGTWPVLSQTARVSLLIVSILLVCLVGYTMATSSRFTPALMTIYERNVSLLAQSQAQEFQKLVDFDLAPEHWKNAESQLDQKVKSTPEVKAMAILDTSRKVLFAATRTAVYASSANAAALPPDLEAGTGIGLSIPLSASGSGAIKGYLWTELDQGFFSSIFLERVLDALTVTVVSLVFSSELLLALGLASGVRRRSVRRPDSPETEAIDNEKGVKVIRFTAFLFFMSELLPLPFMPLFITDLYIRNPLLVFQLSSDAVMSLPFSAHLLGVMLCVPIVGALSNRFSMRKLFFTTGALLLLGNLLAAYAWNLELLMLCRFLSGLGYGGVLAASAGLVVQTTDKDHRTRGFAAWGAGFAAASICAVVLGGTLVTHIGYRNGMIVSAIISIVLGCFILMFHPRKPPVITDENKIKNKVSDLFAIFRDRNALLTLIFASLPVQLAFFGLFQFTLPLVMHQAGISDANIGRILTIYGLFSLAAPVLARFADRTKRERILISVGNLITGVVLTLFFFQHSTLAMVFVVAAIGVGGLMFDTCISAYLTMTRGAAAMGDTKFLSVFLTWEKLFTIFIPIIVGSMMTALGYLESAAVLGLVITVGSVIFLLFTRTPRGHANASNAE